MPSEPGAAAQPLESAGAEIPSESSTRAPDDLRDSDDPSFSTTTSPQPHYNGNSHQSDSAPGQNDSFEGNSPARQDPTHPQRKLKELDAIPSDSEELENVLLRGLSSGQQTPLAEEEVRVTQDKRLVGSDQGKDASEMQNHPQVPGVLELPGNQELEANGQESVSRSEVGSPPIRASTLPTESQQDVLDDVNEADDVQTQPPSFHDLFKNQKLPNSTSSPTHSMVRGLSLSPRSSRSTRSASNHSLQGSQYPEAAGRERSASSTPSKNSSPVLDGSVDSDSMGSLSASDASTNKSYVNRRISPLDNIDRLLTSQSPSTQHAAKANTRLPLRLGLLSFNEQDYDDTEQGMSTSGPGSRSRLHAKYTASADNGVRRHEDRTRKLETENMELKLKLQQYREMNASEQEITRVKWQVERAERRIDELEQALERKNRTIMELSEERDSLASRVRPEHEIEELQSTISDLLTAVSELESQSAAAEEAERATAAAIAETRALMPELIAPNAMVGDLVAALKDLHAENRRLSDIERLLGSINQHLQESGRDSDDPAQSVKILAEDAAGLQQDLADTNAAMAHNQKKYAREMDLLRESQRQQVDALLVSEDKLRQQLLKAQGMQTDLKDKIQELEEIVENQHKIISDTRAESYSIVRRFFSELIDVMGTEFQENVEQELQNVIETAQSRGISKLPLLNELLLRYTRQIAEEAVRSYTAPAVDLKVRAMEQEVQSLEHMLSLKLDKNGADAILLAQNRDLRRALKLEQEKRKTDWNEFTKTVAAIR